jgi:predicted permease
MGREFHREEGELGKDQVIVIGDPLWRSLFAGRPDVVGQSVRVDGRPFTVIGVMPAGFALIDAGVQAWVPLVLTDEEKNARHSNNWSYLARLKPGATVAQAQAQIDGIAAANLDRFPESRQMLANIGFHTVVTRLQDDLVRDVRSTLYLLWGGALFVLLIGGANVASLVLARSRTRVRELATRMALGASRRRVAWQLVVEHVLLTVVSAGVGLLIGYTALGLLRTMNIDEFPRGTEIRMDKVTVAYALWVAGVIGVLLGGAPLLDRRLRSLTTVLREEGRSGTIGRGARTLRRVLVIAQVAIAFVLLIGAGLLLASFRQVLQVDPGFKPEGVITASVNLPVARYGDLTAVRRFTDEALGRLRSASGVARVGATSSIPLGSSFGQSVMFAEGNQLQPGESLIAPYMATVTPGYFEAMGVGLVSGRFFDERDGPDTPTTIIVDERLARRFWPGRDPVGRRMYAPTSTNDVTAITPETRWFTVVGVVREVKLRGLVEGVGDVGAYYFPQTQNPSRTLTFVLRSAASAAPLAGLARTELQRLDAQLPVFEVETMTERTARSLVSRRSPMIVATAFGLVALFLSAVGIYGVLAYLVAQRTKEIGIRLALGSTTSAVFRLVLQEGALLVGTGLVLGVAGVVVLRQAFQSQLFAVRPTDPVVLAITLAALALVAFAACTIPARRATRIDPVSALAE